MSIEMNSIVDIHHHINLQPFSNRTDLERDYDARVRIMDSDKVDQAIISPVQSFYRPRGLDDTRRINDLIAEYVQRYNDRFPVGIGTVLPLQGEGSLAEMERVVNELGLRGFDWHNVACGVPIDHEMMYRFMEHVKQLNVVAFIHAEPEFALEAPWRLDRIASDFPSVTIIALSTLCVWANIPEIIRIAERRSNILLDTFVVPCNRVVEQCVESLGPRRVLYGSDMVALPSDLSYWHSYSLEEIRRSLTLTETQKKLILGENARGLFG